MLERTYMKKQKFPKSVGKMTKEEKRELLVELQLMERWLSDDLPGKGGPARRATPQCQFVKGQRRD